MLALTMTRLTRILACGACALTLASCSLFPAKNAALVRGIRLPLDEDVRFKTDDDIVGGLQVREKNVYFATRKGSVYAFDGDAAKLLWTVPGTRTAASALAAGPDRLAFADADEAIHCLTLDGRELWKSAVQARRLTEVVLASPGVLVVADEDLIIALDADGGAEAWRFKAGAAIQTSLAIWNARIVFGTGDGKIRMIDFQGRAVKGAGETGLARGGPLSIEGNRLFLGLTGGVFRCVDPLNFKPHWTVKTGDFPVSAPVADEKRIYVVTANDVLYAINKRNGNLDWWRMLPARTPFSPVAGEEQIFLASPKTSALTVLDKSTGSHAGSYDLGAEIRSAPALIGGRILVSVYHPDTAEGALVFLKGAPEPAAKQ